MGGGAKVQMQYRLPRNDKTSVIWGRTFTVQKIVYQ